MTSLPVLILSIQEINSTAAQHIHTVTFVHEGHHINSFQTKQ